MKKQQRQHLLIITGPTASGKTALSELILKQVSGQIINADVGQFYVPLIIGTAKPDLKNLFYQTHCFDILDQPKDLSVVDYRQRVITAANQIWHDDQLPIVVGGSLFYIKSFFFPPFEYAQADRDVATESREPYQENLWQQLHAIDPLRAEQLHPNDIYRIQRALAIWKKTGKKPSTYKPIYQPFCDVEIIFVNPEKSFLQKKIKDRVEQMMQLGWIKEVEELVGTSWEPFLKQKGLIGYPEIFDWIARGKSRDEYQSLIELIQNDTIDYAKRQVTFWKSFSQQLKKISGVSSFTCHVMEVSSIEQSAVDEILSAMKN